MKTINNYISRYLKLILVISMFLDQNPSDEEHTLKNWRVSLLMLLPMCSSCAIPMHVAYAHLVHAAYGCPSVVAFHLRRSSTPKILRTITQTTILTL